MEIKIYNTLTKQTEIFHPLKPRRVGLYTCGPTVYNYAHIGNLRTYVFEDILKRVLEYNKYRVKHIMNITDVGHLTDDADAGEDKMETGAKREGKTAWDIAKFYTKAFKNDLADLNILKPNKWCRATKHIKEQIQFIKKIEKKGFTYITSDGVYFNTSKLSNYGQLANLQNQKLQAGVRVDMGEKKNPTDFALWKFSKPEERRQMEWKSPWGIGFPGWHIECSAMSEKYLGKNFDIHCGGIDHIPVHHTNEIAQSEAVNDKIPANYWLHGEFLLVNEGKMAKSEGNFLTLQTLKNKGISPLSYRYFLLQTHYRKQLNFSWEALESANQGLKHLYRETSELKQHHVVISTKTTTILENKFLNFINDDLNIPNALALIWESLKTKTIDLPTLLKFDEILGLDIKNNLKIKSEDIPTNIKNIMAERELARQQKDWSKSDELRNTLEKLGYGVEDSKEKTQITKL